MLLLTLALVLTLLWPVLLGVLRVYPPTSTLARRLLPLALLPALVVAIMPAGHVVVELPGVLLDSSITRDNITRLFLLLIVLLVTPLLAFVPTSSKLTDRDKLFDLLLLLFVVGLLTLVLSGGVLLFFTAGTMAGYALYGMLMSHASTAGRRAGRVLVVLLIISDLLIFELLLLLSSQGLTFELLRQSLAGMGGDYSALLTLMLIGFASKAGLVGLHFWLPPVWLRARPQLRPAILAFMLCAGLLAILRLLPLGQLHWPAAGQLLQWLALAMSGYALLTGLLQTRQAAAWAHVVMLFMCIWLVMLCMLLIQPELLSELATIWHIVLLQSVLGLAVLAMLGQYRAPLWLCRLAVLNLAMAILLLMSIIPASSNVTQMPLHVTGAAAVMLAVAILRRQRPLSTAITRGTKMVVWLWLLLGLILVPVLLLVSGAQLSYASLWPAMLWLFIAAMAGGWIGASAGGRILPPGDLLPVISTVLNWLVSAGRWLGEVILPRWRDRMSAWVWQNWQQLCQQGAWQSVAGLLMRWELAIFLLLVVGLLMTVFSIIDLLL
jgi:NADH:ubiquinone oxidoreductase subunit 2 (subunit N)